MDLYEKAEANKLAENERRRRRQLRISQVRQQTDNWTSNSRTKFEEEKARQLRKLIHEVTEEVIAEAVQNLEQLSAQHDLAVNEIGGAHRAAANHPDTTKLKELKRAENEAKAAKRFDEAMKKERLERLKKEAEAAKLLQIREAIRLQENDKAKFLADRRPFRARNVDTKPESTRNKLKRQGYQQSIAQSLHIPPESQVDKENRKPRVKRHRKKTSKTRRVRRRKPVCPGPECEKGSFGQVAEARRRRVGLKVKKHRVKSPRGDKNGHERHIRPRTKKKKKEGDDVIFVDSTIPLPPQKYKAPDGLVHREPHHTARPNAWKNAEKANKEKAKENEKKRDDQAKINQKVKIRGAAALKIARLEQQYKQLANEVVEDEDESTSIPSVLQTQSVPIQPTPSSNSARVLDDGESSELTRMMSAIVHSPKTSQHQLNQLLKLEQEKSAITSLNVPEDIREVKTTTKHKPITKGNKPEGGAQHKVTFQDPHVSESEESELRTQHTSNRQKVGKAQSIRDTEPGRMPIESSASQSKPLPNQFQRTMFNPKEPQSDLLSGTKTVNVPVDRPQAPAPVSRPSNQLLSLVQEKSGDDQSKPQSRHVDKPQIVKPHHVITPRTGTYKPPDVPRRSLSGLYAPPQDGQNLSGTSAMYSPPQELPFGSRTGLYTPPDVPSSRPITALYTPPDSQSSESQNDAPGSVEKNLRPSTASPKRNKLLKLTQEQSEPKNEKPKSLVSKPEVIAVTKIPNKHARASPSTVAFKAHDIPATAPQSRREEDRVRDAVSPDPQDQSRPSTSASERQTKPQPAGTVKSTRTVDQTDQLQTQASHPQRVRSTVQNKSRPVSQSRIKRRVKSTHRPNKSKTAVSRPVERGGVDKSRPGPSKPSQDQRPDESIPDSSSNPERSQMPTTSKPPKSHPRQAEVTAPVSSQAQLKQQLAQGKPSSAALKSRPKPKRRVVQTHEPESSTSRSSNGHADQVEFHHQPIDVSGSPAMGRPSRTIRHYIKQLLSMRPESMEKLQISYAESSVYESSSSDSVVKVNTSVAASLFLSTDNSLSGGLSSYHPSPRSSSSHGTPSSRSPRSLLSLEEVSEEGDMPYTSTPGPSDVSGSTAVSINVIFNPGSPAANRGRTGSDQSLAGVLAALCARQENCLSESLQEDYPVGRASDGIPSIPRISPFLERMQQVGMTPAPAGSRSQTKSPEHSTPKSASKQGPPPRSPSGSSISRTSRSSHGTTNSKGSGSTTNTKETRRGGTSSIATAGWSSPGRSVCQKSQVQDDPLPSVIGQLASQWANISIERPPWLEA